MVTFKQQLESDINVFLNSSEFGDTYNINGSSIVGIFENYQLDNQEGIYKGQRVLHVKTSDIQSLIPDIHASDKVITIDSVNYRVLNVDDQVGMTKLTLTSHEGMRLFTVKYRSVTGTGGDPDLGIPSTKTDWVTASSLYPTPQYTEQKNEIKVDNIGIIRSGDVKLVLEKDSYVKTDLESYEYQIDGIEYSLINGQVLETRYQYELYLRRKQ